MAKWWESSIMVALSAVFALLVRAGLRSTGPGVWPHVIIPPYGLFLYATLATMVNKRTVIATPKELVMTNGPLPLRARRRIAREDVASTYHVAITALNENGDQTIVFGHTCGIQTRTGVHVQVFGTFKEMEAARDSAQRIADALGAAGGTHFEVRHLTNITDDPADKRMVLIWFGIIAIAFIAGFLWDLSIRA